MKIQSSAPCRVSLFGGSTDLPEYAEHFGGLVLSVAINIRQHITMYSEDQLFEINQSTFPLNANPQFYYKILDEFGINDGIHLTKLCCQFDGLIESGLGSSASAAVALVGAINKRKNLGLSLDQIINKAWDLEVNKIGLYGGKQDQIAAAYGGINIISFYDTFEVTALARSVFDGISASLVLLYLGENRKSTTIQDDFKNLSIGKTEKLNEIKQLSLEGIQAVMDGDIEKVGYLMDQSFVLKRQSNEGVSNPHINSIYRKGLENGAYGGKVLGSGGGGYMLFVVDPKTRNEFIRNMGLEEWDFDISMDGLDVRNTTNK